MTDIHKKILEDTLAGYWDRDVIEGKDFLSPTFKSMLGYEEDELDDSPQAWQELIFPEDRSLVLANFEEHEKSKGAIPFRNVVRYKHKDGSTVWVLYSGSIIEWEGDKAKRIVGCHIDVTKQKEAEKKLERTQRLLRQTSETARVGGWEVDVVKNTTTWTNITYEIHEESLDYIPVVETALQYYKQGESRKKIEKAFAALVEKGELFDLELQIVTAKGNEKWVRTIGAADFVDGKCIRAYGTFQDIDKQKRTQLNLELSEIRFKDAFEHSAIGMALVSLEGNWLKVNEQVCDIVGYSKEELLTKTFQDITHPDDLDIDLDNVQMLIEGSIDSYQMEKRYFHKYGQVVWVLLSVSLIRDPKGVPIHFISQLEDVTERKSIERKLKKANQELRGIYDATTHVSVIATDYEGMITYFGSGAEKLLGYSADEMINKQTPAVIHLEEEVVERGKELSQQYGETISGFRVFIENVKRGKHDSREWTYVRKDGSTFPVQLVVTAVKSETGSITGFLGVATDISQIKKAEEEVRRSHELLSTLTKNVPGFIYQFQIDKNGKSSFPYANSGIENIYEVSPKEVKQDASVAFERIFKEDFKKVKDSIAKSAETLEDWVCEYRVDLPKGGIKWLKGDAKPEKLEDGSTLWHGYINDITEKKEDELELRKTLDVISEQNKRLYNFAHIVTHNLRSYSGNFELLLQLLESADSKDERTELESHLKGVARQLSQTIEHLSEVVSIQTANIKKDIKELELAQYIAKTIEILSGDINIHNVALDINVPKGVCVSYIEAYLESILLNFISNAIKYRSPKRDPIVTINANKVDDRVELEISDNGLGIDLDKHGEKLFGMYNTFHGNEDANGIGLFITKNQIEAMGGVVNVSSVLDEGTTFKILF